MSSPNLSPSGPSPLSNNDNADTADNVYSNAPVTTPKRQDKASTTVNRNVGQPKEPDTSFKKVLAKKKKDGSSTDQEEEEELAQQQVPGTSIFDLSSKKGPDLSSELPGQSAALLQQNPKLGMPKYANVAEQDIAEIPIATQAPVDTSKSKTTLLTEQDNVVIPPNPDLLAMMAAAATTLAIAPDPKQAPLISDTTAQLQATIEQIVDKAYTLQTSGQTDTVLVLKQPPLFQGAEVVITAFDSAKGQFNIAFNNLTQSAQQVLSMQANQANLLHGLEQKGYFVHIIVVTTNPIETPNLGQQAGLAKQQKDGQEAQQDQRQGQGRQQKQG